MVSIGDLLECANQALGTSEHRAIAGGRRCAEYVQRLLSTEPITPERLKERGFELFGSDWCLFGIADLVLSVDGWCVCRVNCRPGVLVHSMGELELELARIELAREV